MKGSLARNHAHLHKYSGFWDSEPRNRLPKTGFCRFWRALWDSKNRLAAGSDGPFGILKTDWWLGSGGPSEWHWIKSEPFITK